MQSRYAGGENDTTSGHCAAAHAVIRLSETSPTHPYSRSGALPRKIVTSTMQRIRSAKPGGSRIFGRGTRQHGLPSDSVGQVCMENLTSRVSSSLLKIRLRLSQSFLLACRTCPLPCPSADAASRRRAHRSGRPCAQDRNQDRSRPCRSPVAPTARALSPGRPYQFSLKRRTPATRGAEGISDG